MKIVVTENISDRGLEVLRRNNWEVVFLPESGGELEQEIVDADGLIVRSVTQVTEELLSCCRKLRVVGRAGVGVDNIDLEAATKKGVVVMNTPGGNSVSVAEHTMALLTSLARAIPRANTFLKSGKWAKEELLGVELQGKVLGLIGLGRVGIEVFKRAHAFGMKILVFDPYVSPRVAEDLDVRLVDLEEVLAQSDVISLHASLTPETEHLINRESLAKMKPGVRIVNCGRGELIDEAALLEALESGHVDGAGLDVFEVEPPQPGSAGAKLMVHQCVVATPHIAGSTEEAQDYVGLCIAEHLSEYLIEGISKSAVNMPSVSPEEFKKLEPYIKLGENEGSFLAQMSTGQMDYVRISYDGGLAELDAHLVKVAVLKGILNVILSEKTNLINAETIAEERGIIVEELRSKRRVAVSNSLGVSLRTGGNSQAILGMVGMGGNLRILGINDIDVEAPLEGTILFIKNKDIPGVIGRVGTILGNSKVNIANFALGRAREVSQAVGVVNVDQAVREEVLEEIRAVPAVEAVRLIQL